MKYFKLKPIIALVCFVLLGSSFAFSQRQITGTVTDAENGEPLIGASVRVKGTAAGAVTDIDGKYRLALPNDATEVDVSYTGYATKTLTVGASNVIDVALSPGVVLEETLVIGYGTVKKEDATGSVNAVTEKSFNRGAIVSPEALVSGKIAGVQITSNSGEPGGQTTVRVRGGTSVNASNEPLYVIDGVPIDNTPHNPGGFSNGRNPLNFINAADIESITVLKDASATAIYGSRGANGVIMITTKKGKKGSPGRLSYDGYYTTSSFTEKPPVLNAEEFKNVVTYIAPERLDKLGGTSTNWFDAITQDAKGQSHSLSFSGGAQNLGYRASVGYQKLDGVLRSSSTERISASLAFNQSLFDDRLNVNFSLKSSRTKDQFDPGQIGAAWSFDPTQPIYDRANTAFAGFFEYNSALAPRNPVSAYVQNQDFDKVYRNIASMDAEYKMDDFIKGLSAKLILGVDVQNGERSRFQPTTYINKLVSNYAGELRIENLNRTNPLLDFYLNYKKDIGEHHRVDFTAGYSYQDFRNEYPSFRAYNLSTNAFGANSTTPAEDFEANNSVVENRLISFFGRANYAYMDKYLLTFTLRRDGSTRFGPSNRWGWFPSGALAWRIMQEGFAQGWTSVLSDLKLRLGYGITGNQAIPDFAYLPTYRYSDVRARYQFGYSNGEPVFVTTVRPNGYDPNLKWEETSSYNAGLDFGFLNGRINGTLEYYYKKTKDLLFTVSIPAGTNLTDRVLTNIGELENRGIELSLDGYVFNTRDFSWNIGFNIANNKNKVLAIDQVSDQGVLTGDISGGVGNKIQILQVGQPINSFFVFQQKYGTDGKPLKDGIDYNDDGVVDLKDMYEDINGDGVVSDLDKRPFKKPAPSVLIGISSSLSYMNFDLNFTLRASTGNYTYNNNASVAGYLNRVNERGDIFLNNIHQSALVTGFTDRQYFSDYYVEDASFLRMDNITLGYTIPHMPKSSSLRLYVTAQNPFVWTKYSGLDPEVGAGIDNNPYPRSRAYIFGLSLGL